MTRSNYYYTDIRGLLDNSTLFNTLYVNCNCIFGVLLIKRLAVIYTVLQLLAESRAPRDVLDLNCYKCISKEKRQSNTFLINRRNSSKKEPLPKVTKAYFYIYFPFPSLHRNRALTERVNYFFFFQSSINCLSKSNLSLL